MEQLLHYVWKHKLLPLELPRTVDGQTVEVIDTGLHNRHAGPDFFNAKVKIGGTLWVGNVEIHDRASDWYAHGHDRDTAYNNVVLHVVGENDTDVMNAQGQYVAQMQLDVPEPVRQHYEELLREDKYPPCHKLIPQLTRLTIHAWLAALQTERLERKTQDIARRAELCGGSWEDAYFQTLARNFGFGINSDVFEQWARQVPLQAAGKHRDDAFQVEALFLGQAGLLDPQSVPPRYQAAAAQEGYFDKLRNEYRYLAHKFGLQPMDFKLWRFLRLRPQNFPHIRIAQMVTLYHERRAGLSQLLECENTEQLRRLLTTHVTPYWETHYTFGSESTKSKKQLSDTSLNLLMLNTAIPMLFAMGHHRQKEEWCDRAFDLLEQLKAERNHVIAMWQECGVEVKTAGDSQALLQLKNEYCDKKECLRCRFGYEYLRHANTTTK